MNYQDKKTELLKEIAEISKRIKVLEFKKEKAVKEKNFKHAEYLQQFIDRERGQRNWLKDFGMENIEDKKDYTTNKIMMVVLDTINMVDQ